MAVVNNAKDHEEPDVYEEKIQEAREFFDQIGLKFDVIDLRAFDGPEKLEEKLKDYDLIWGNGGNTFMLLYEMKRSGFDKVIRKLLEKGVVYGGESAGAIVAGASLRGIEFADDPEFAKEVHWDGMKLIDQSILPHADTPVPLYVERLPEFLKQYADNPDDLIVLNDNEAFIVDGNDSRKVSYPYKQGTHEVDYKASIS
jgi:dipeptidase E